MKITITILFILTWFIASSQSTIILHHDSVFVKANTDSVLLNTWPSNTTTSIDYLLNGTYARYYAGLFNVDNTSDVNKPISAATQTALNAKLSSITSGNVTTALGYTPLNSANNLSDVTAATARTNLGLGTLSTQSGTFSGTSSGTNTGDQTITLTGNITGSGTGSFATTIASGVVTNAMLAGSIAASKLVGSDITLTESQTTNLTTDLGNKQGISAGATTATTGTMTVTMTSATQNVFTITPTGACTFNASGGKAGAIAIFAILTSGTSAFVLTWSTNFKTTATLSTGTTSGKRFNVSFICVDGTVWTEMARTAAQ